MKRPRQTCHSRHIPFAQITGEGGGTIKRGLQICHSRHIPCAQITGKGRGTFKRLKQIYHFLHIPFAQITGEGGGTIKGAIQTCNFLHNPCVTRVLDCGYFFRVFLWRMSRGHSSRTFSSGVLSLRIVHLEHTPRHQLLLSQRSGW